VNIGYSVVVAERGHMQQQGDISMKNPTVYINPFGK
jgi:hypothetical protein